jgi:hypothetical protein
MLPRPSRHPSGRRFFRRVDRVSFPLREVERGSDRKGARGKPRFEYKNRASPYYYCFYFLKKEEPVSPVHRTAKKPNKNGPENAVTLCKVAPPSPPNRATGLFRGKNIQKAQ